MKKTICFLLFAYIMAQAFSQDSLSRKNILCFIPTNLVSKTVTVSYYSIINPKTDIYIQTGLSTMVKDLSNYILIPNKRGWKLKDPCWNYDRITTQFGITRHFNIFYIEPKIRYEYGFYANKVLKMGEHEEGYIIIVDKWELDRKYHAIGLLMSSGICVDFGSIRWNIFGELGEDLRFYKENVHEKYYQLPGGIETYYINTDNAIAHYTKGHFVIKIGIELGFKF